MDAILRFKRQNLLREQNTLEVILRIIHSLRSLSVERTESELTKMPIEEANVSKQGAKVLDLCLSLLFRCIEENEENQM